MILQNQRNSSDRHKSGIMLGLVLGNGKERQAKSTSLAESRCAKDSADHSYLFLAQTVGLETWVMQQSETHFCFSNFETKQKLGIRNTPRFVLKNWDMRIKSV